MSYELRRLMKQVVVKLLDEAHIRGILGRTNEDGTVTIASIDRKSQGYVYVTLTQDGSQTVTIAENTGVPEIPNLPVKMIREDGRLVIVGIDSKGGRLAVFRNGKNIGSVAKHTHNRDSGLEYEHETMWLEPGRVIWAGPSLPLGVTIRPFVFFSTISKRYPGGTFDLTSYKPTTANKYAWIIVGLNPVTNLPTAVRGAEYSTLAELTDARIADINFGNNIPLVAIQAFQGDTAFSDITYYRDARRWLDPPSFAAASYIDGSTGPTDAGKPIKTNSLGTVDKSLIPPFQSFGIGFYHHWGEEIVNADLPLTIVTGGEEGCDNGVWAEWFVIADPTGTPVTDAGTQYVAPGATVSISPSGGQDLQLGVEVTGGVVFTGTLTVTHKVSVRLHWIN